MSDSKSPANIAPEPDEKSIPAAETATDSQTEIERLKNEAEKWKSMSRKNEDRAKENAEKAKRLDELEDQNKTETQKLAEQLETARREAEQLKRWKLVNDVAADKQVPAKFLQGETREELEAFAEEFRALLESNAVYNVSSDIAGDIGEKIEKPTQLRTKDELQNMTPEQVMEAYSNGAMDDFIKT